MSKKELIDKLVSMGYEAEMVDGIPYIFNLPYSKASKIIKEIGYKGTYGIRERKETEKDENT